MSRIAIVGGHGQIAQHLIGLLLGSGDVPVPLVRRQEQLDELAAGGAEPRLLDIENSDVDAFAAAFEGCDAVVFAAGGGPDGSVERKRTVDLEGSTKSVAGARQAGVPRFVQVSAISVDEELAEDTSPVWRAYVEAKREADRVLRGSDLAWTVVRPGGLSDEPATGRVELGRTVERGEIPRADVAAVLAACLADERSVGSQFEVVGGDVEVAAAVAAAPAFTG